MNNKCDAPRGLTVAIGAGKEETKKRRSSICEESRRGGRDEPEHELWKISRCSTTEGGNCQRKNKRKEEIRSVERN